MSHNHNHTHNHSHSLQQLNLKRLAFVFGINLFFLVIEFVGGLLTNSMALLSDAGHMLTDVLALLIALLAARLAQRPPTPQKTFGLLRAEVLGAFLNGASLVLVVGVIFSEAVRRLSAPPEVLGGWMLPVAVAGLFANGISVWLLHADRKRNVNMEGAFLHMLADTLGSVGAIIAAVVIHTTGWNLIDPLASLFIGALILWGSIGLLRKSTRILLNATPAELNYREIMDALLEFPHFAEVYDLHIWSVTDGVVILSAHIRIKPECVDSAHRDQCLLDAQKMLHNRFGIEHATLQLETADHPKAERNI